jgi:fido (protein-threonine AMPylation protein)
MELQILDPFGDHESAGYLRNVCGVKDLELIGHLETAVFQQEVLRTVRFLRRVQTLQYEHLLETHRQFFHSLYPWAGEDRSITAPHLAIVKAGYKAEFSKPGEPKQYIPKISQETLAEMIGTTRSRVSFFMNRFRKLSFIEYNGRIKVHKSLLDVVLQEEFTERHPERVPASATARSRSKPARRG